MQLMASFVTLASVSNSNLVVIAKQMVIGTLASWSIEDKYGFLKCIIHTIYLVHKILNEMVEAHAQKYIASFPGPPYMCIASQWKHNGTQT